MRTTYKAMAYVAGFELLELGNFDNEDDASDCLMEYFTDSQTGEIDEHGLSCSQIKPVKWLEYYCEFWGRLLNAQGEISFIEETIYSTKPMSEDNLRLSLSSRYQDISRLNFIQKL